MKDYKRLKEKISNILYPPLPFDGDELTGEDIKELWNILHKIENGTLIELPCKVGDRVYVISKKALKGHWDEHRYIVDEWGKLSVHEKEFNLALFSVSKVGEDYFLTKAEAEKKLEEELKNER